MARSTKQIEGDETVHHVSARAKRERPKPRMQPPLTPMIDVTFQLLLFFLLTFTFRQAEGQIPGSLPQTAGVAAGQVVDLPTIKIRLIPTGEFKDKCIFEMSGLSARIGTPKELYERLMARRQDGTADAPVVIRARGDVRWEHVVEAFNAAVHAEYKNIGFAPTSSG